MMSEKEAYLSSLGTDASGNTASPKKGIGKKKPVTMAELIRQMLFGKKEEKPKLKSKEEEERERLRQDEPGVMP